MTAQLQINSDRLWSRLQELAGIGATAAGGCNRQALTDEDRDGRRQFMSWCERAGCTLRVDAIGNIFARRAGTGDDLPAVLTGSHLDTQPTGGKYDGVFGVLAGLEVLETLNDNTISTDHPLELVVWTNEEGARFEYAMMGSAAWAGVLPLEDAYALTDRQGRSVHDELLRIDFKGDSQDRRSYKAAFETHIEQGPILELRNCRIGIVTGVQHMCRFRVLMHGQECHAGPSPMEQRRDPVMGLAQVLPALYQAAAEYAPDSRLTIGFLNASPGSGNTVPGCVEFSIDLRHPEMESYAELQQRINDCVSDACARYGLQSSVEKVWEAPGVSFDSTCINWVEQATQTANIDAMRMISGAGHDSVNVSKLVPTSMIFIPCKDGLSHNELESINKSQASDGANVLLQTMLAAARAN